MSDYFWAHSSLCHTFAVIKHSKQQFTHKKQTYEKDFLHHHRSHRHHLIFNMYGTFAYQSNQSKPYIDFKKR